MIFLLLSLISPAAEAGGRYDVPLDPPLYASNAVEVTWTASGPRVAIPASASPATDFFETEVLPMGRVDASGAWRFVLPPGLQGPTWSELLLFPATSAVQAVVTGPNRRDIYALVYDDGREGPLGTATPSYNLVLDGKYLVTCEGTACPKR